MRERRTALLRDSKVRDLADTVVVRIDQDVVSLEILLSEKQGTKKGQPSGSGTRGEREDGTRGRTRWRMFKL